MPEDTGDDFGCFTANFKEKSLLNSNLYKIIECRFLIIT